MKQVTSVVEIHPMQVKKITEAAKSALAQTAEELHGRVLKENVMPRDTGAMEGENTFVDDSGIKRGNVELVTSTPYARRLYYHPEYHFNKEHNPNAGGKWLAPWLKSGKYDGEVEKTYGKIYGMMLNGGGE